MKLQTLFAAVSFLILSFVNAAEAPAKKPDVVYVPTPQAVVDKMLEMAEVKKGDVVYDLGCGDGRSIVTAAKRYGVKAIGFDIDPERVKESLANVRTNKVEHLVSIQQKDIFTLDLREATVVFLYLLPSLNVRLMPQLAKLKPGSRIVSHDFDMRGAKPVQVATVTSDNGGTDEMDYDDGDHTIYKWVVPWEKEVVPPNSEKKANNDK
jgi:SAM-dependent methyltransferase